MKNKPLLETRRLKFLKELYFLLKEFKGVKFNHLCKTHHISANARLVLLTAGIIDRSKKEGKVAWVWAGPRKGPDLDTVALFAKHFEEIVLSKKNKIAKAVDQISSNPIPKVAIEEYQPTEEYHSMKEQLNRIEGLLKELHIHFSGIN